MKTRIAIALAGAVAGITVALPVAKATELVYGFDSGTVNGFAISYDQDATAAVSQSTTTGVTNGSGALHIHVGPTGGGYDQIDVATTQVPVDLIAAGTSSISMDAAANYANAGYITLAPVLYLAGTVDGVNGYGAKLLLPAKTLPYDAGVTTDHTYTYSLLMTDPFATAHAAGSVYGPAATPADGHSTSTLYTPGQILSAVLTSFKSANSNATGSLGTFALEETTNTFASGTSDLGDDLYVDNITIPSVPEPASLAAVAAGALLLGRRRRGE